MPEVNVSQGKIIVVIAKIIQVTNKDFSCRICMCRLHTNVYIHTRDYMYMSWITVFAAWKIILRSEILICVLSV